MGGILYSWDYTVFIYLWGTDYSGYFNSRKCIIRIHQDHMSQVSEKHSERQTRLPLKKSRSWRVIRPHDKFPGFLEVLLNLSAAEFHCSLLPSVSTSLSHLLLLLNQVIHFPYVSFPLNHYHPCLGRALASHHNEGHWQAYMWISF